MQVYYIYKTSANGREDAEFSDIFECVWREDDGKKGKLNRESFVWYDNKGLGRNLHANFRRSFTIECVPSTVEFSIFADTVYQLMVNGAFVGFGPVRFNPKFPKYDEYDLSPFLSVGENVISIRVNNFGTKTYKAVQHIAGLCCRGTISSGNKIISLTGESFKVVKAPEHHIYAPKMSFALDPNEVYDQRAEHKGWTKPGFDDSDWNYACRLDDQAAWGLLEPRPIPMMSIKEIDLDTPVKILPLVTDEDIYSFDVPIPGFYDDDFCNSKFIAMKTWVYSPRKQSVVVGTFWGESWVNGKEVEKGLESDIHSLRINEIWHLEEGFNFYMGKVVGYSDCLHQVYDVQKSAGLVFKAEKDFNCPYYFAHSKIVTEEDYIKYLEPKDLPYSEDELLNEIGGWVYVDESRQTNSSAKAIAWDKYGQQFESVSFKELKKKTFSKELYPNGFSLLIDVEHTRLLLPKYSFSGVDGCIIDYSGCEKLNRDGLHFEHVHQYLSGDRFICADNTEESVSYMPISPRGFMFFNLTVRNTKGDVTLNELTFLNASYPTDEIPEMGEFECSDRMLNCIWESCKLTLAINMEDAYVDCVTRERGMYIMDTIIQYYNNTAVFNDQSLFKYCMELYANSADETGKYRAVYPNDGEYTLADFSLKAIEGHLIYYMNSGDINHLRDCWDNMLANMKWFDDLSDQREDRLIPVFWNTIVDKDDEIGFRVNCSYLEALNNIIKIAKIIEKADCIQKIQDRVNTLRNSISTLFYIEEEHAFKEKIGSTKPSYEATLSVVRCGAATEEQLPLVRKFINDNMVFGMFYDGHTFEKYVVSPSLAFYSLDAIYSLGLPEIAEMLIKSGWSTNIIRGYKTVLEYFNTTLQRSLCHAWSASPIYYLSKNLSGVTFTDAPNNKNVVIDVKAFNIRWAKVKYPHPQGGFITVNWHLEDGKRVFDEVSAPEGVSVTIVNTQ